MLVAEQDNVQASLIKGSRKTANLSIVKRQERTLVKVQPQLHLQAQDGRGYASKLKTDTTESASDRLLVKAQPSCHKGTQRIVAAEWRQPEPGRQVMGAAEGRVGKMTRTIWRNSEDHV